MDLASGIWRISQERQNTLSQKLATGCKCLQSGRKHFRDLAEFEPFGSKMAVLVDADRDHPKPPLEPTHPKPQNEQHDHPENHDDPLPNSAADDFFVNLNRDFRRPKPSEEAVAAALHAI